MKLPALKRTSILILLTTMFLGVASAAIAVVETKQHYDGACSRLEGFAGMVQQAGFLTQGDCQIQFDLARHQKCGGSCKVGGKNGGCVNAGTYDKCICVCDPNISPTQ